MTDVGAGPGELVVEVARRQQVGRDDDPLGARPPGGGHRVGHRRRARPSRSRSSPGPAQVRCSRSAVSSTSATARGVAGPGRRDARPRCSGSRGSAPAATSRSCSTSASRGSGPSGRAATAPGEPATAPAMSTCTWYPPDSSSGTTTAGRPGRGQLGDHVDHRGRLDVDERRRRRQPRPQRPGGERQLGDQPPAGRVAGAVRAGDQDGLRSQGAEHAAVDRRSSCRSGRRRRGRARTRRPGRTPRAGRPGAAGSPPRCGARIAAGVAGGRLDLGDPVGGDRCRASARTRGCRAGRARRPAPSRSSPARAAARWRSPGAGSARAPRWTARSRSPRRRRGAAPAP